MWFISPNFEKLRRNLRKGILKGIYWILTGLRVGILNKFCVVLLRDFFYYTAIAPCIPSPRSDVPGTAVHVTFAGEPCLLKRSVPSQRIDVVCIRLMIAVSFIPNSPATSFNCQKRLNMARLPARVCPLVPSRALAPSALRGQVHQ